MIIKIFSGGDFSVSQSVKAQNQQWERLTADAGKVISDLGELQQPTLNLRIKKRSKSKVKKIARLAHLVVSGQNCFFPIPVKCSLDSNEPTTDNNKNR